MKTDDTRCIRRVNSIILGTLGNREPVLKSIKSEFLAGYQLRPPTYFHIIWHSLTKFGTMTHPGIGNKHILRSWPRPQIHSDRSPVAWLFEMPNVSLYHLTSTKFWTVTHVESVSILTGDSPTKECDPMASCALDWFLQAHGDSRLINTISIELTYLF